MASRWRLSFDPRPAARRNVLTLPLAGDPATLLPPGERTSISYQVPLPADLPPGGYVVAVRALGPDGQALPVTLQPRRPEDVPSEPDAVPLRRLDVR